MKKNLRIFIAALGCFATMATAKAQITAFPGAEGFGRFATGGRGGEVYHVTNLNDSGAGSLRDAVSKSNRIVVFDVGGVIKITDRIVIQKNIYVAGQTAPGDGITIYGNGVALNNNSGNSIIRYIRIRMGENGDYRKDALGISDGQNYMFDNVSISWGWDGTVDVNGSNIDNITFQDCIIGQGLDIVGHSTGGLVQSGKWSAIRTIYVDNETRNPKGKGTQEVMNCVMYNWGSNGYIMGSTDGLSEANVVGNNFIYGPASSSNSHITNTTPAFNVYGLDNWVDANKNGKFDPSLMTDYKTATKVSKPFNYDGMKKVMPAAQALEYVLANAGASRPHDAVDKYLINEIKSYGTKGAIIKRESDNGIPGNVGTVANGTPPKDTDKDGMSDEWETKRGLNPKVADDKGDDDKDGYTNIEEYLSCLVGEGDGCGDTTPPKPTDCAGVENGTAKLDNCDRCVGGNTGKVACTSAGEAEADACNFDGTVDNNNVGFKGTGFINVPNAIGSEITFHVNATTAGSKTLSFRYASGGTSSRAATITLNGTALAANLNFPATGAFTTYKTVDVNLNLKSGVNIVQLTSTTADGLANIDQIGYVSTGLSKGDCEEVVTNILSGNQPQSLELYPNPSQSSFNIRTSDPLDIEITDAEGKTLKTYSNVSELEFGADLIPGVYFAKVQNKVYKFVKY